MHSISKAIVPCVAFLTMVQYCTAPILPALFVAVAVSGVSVSVDAGTVAGIIGAAAGVAGAVTSSIHHSRDIKSKPRQFMSRIKRQDISNLGLGTAVSDCYSQLVGASLNFSSTSTTTVLVAGIPPACMTLCGVITGIYDEGNPVPLGTDSVSFTNLSADDIQQIQNALDVHPNYQK